MILPKIFLKHNLTLVVGLLKSFFVLGFFWAIMSISEKILITRANCFLLRWQKYSSVDWSIALDLNPESDRNIWKRALPKTRSTNHRHSCIHEEKKTETSRGLQVWNTWLNCKRSFFLDFHEYIHGAGIKLYHCCTVFLVNAFKRSLIWTFLGIHEKNVSFFANLIS